jgi:predicted nucleic acid-binding protein
MKALIDTDAILDIFLQRAPFVVAATALWIANERGRFEVFISGITPVNAFYFVREQADNDAARRAVRSLLDTMHVCAIDEATLNAAHVLALTDYEDAGQHACVAENGLDAIVTRNVDDYRRATLPIFSPAGFLAQLPQ